MDKIIIIDYEGLYYSDIRRYANAHSLSFVPFDLYATLFDNLDKKNTIYYFASHMVFAGASELMDKVMAAMNSDNTPPYTVFFPRLNGQTVTLAMKYEQWVYGQADMKNELTPDMAGEYLSILGDPNWVLRCMKEDFEQLEKALNSGKHHCAHLFRRPPKYVHLCMDKLVKEAGGKQDEQEDESEENKNE